MPPKDKDKYNNLNVSMFFSDDDGKTYKPFDLENVPTIIEGVDLANEEDICVYQPVMVGSIKLKKRHQSRKWKKKRGLLKRQNKRAIKQFGRAIYKLVKAVGIAAKFVKSLSFLFKDIGKLKPQIKQASTKGRTVEQNNTSSEEKI